MNCILVTKIVFFLFSVHIQQITNYLFFLLQVRVDVGYNLLHSFGFTCVRSQTMLARMRRNGNPLSLLVRMHAGAAALENSVEVPQKTKKKTTLRPSYCTTRYLSKGYKNADLRGHMHPNVYSSAIDNSLSMERAQMSID